MWRLAVFCAVLAVVNGQTTSVLQCIHNEGSVPINTYIDGCVTPPCVLPQLQDVVVNIVFESPRVMNRMTTVATAYVQGLFGLILPIPYGLGDDAETCNFLSNTYCPLLRGEIVLYTLRMHIESFFPEDTIANIEFRVVDESNVPVLCIRVPIRIGPPVIASSMDETLEKN